MTVSELIERLKAFPQDAVVKVPEEYPTRYVCDVGEPYQDAQGRVWIEQA